METTLFSCRKGTRWNTDHWQLVSDKPGSCNFRCHHAWVSLLSGKSGFGLRCLCVNQSSRGKDRQHAEGSSLPMDQPGGYLGQQFFESPQQNSIGKITPCPSLNNIKCLKPIYRKELNREKTCICVSPFLTASPWKALLKLHLAPISWVFHLIVSYKL